MATIVAVPSHIILVDNLPPESRLFVTSDKRVQSQNSLPKYEHETDTCLNINKERQAEPLPQTNLYIPRHHLLKAEKRFQDLPSFRVMSDSDLNILPNGIENHNRERNTILSNNPQQDLQIYAPFTIALALGDYYFCISVDRNQIPSPTAFLKPVRRSLRQLRRWRCEGIFLLAWLMHICLIWTLHSLDTAKAAEAHTG